MTARPLNYFGPNVRPQSFVWKSADGVSSLDFPLMPTRKFWLVVRVAFLPAVLGLLATMTLVRQPRDYFGVIYDLWLVGLIAFASLYTFAGRNGSIRLTGRWIRVQTPLWHRLSYRYPRIAAKLKFGVDADCSEIADVITIQGGVFDDWRDFGELLIVHVDGSRYPLGAGRPLKDLEAAAQQLRTAMAAAGWSPVRRESQHLGLFNWLGRCIRFLTRA